MSTSIYETKSVNRLIMTFSVPAIVALIIEMMTSVVDTVFAGHIGSASVDGLTAMGLLAPLLSIFTATQALFAVSTAILTASHLQSENERGEYIIIGLLGSVAVSLTVSLGVFLAMDAVLTGLGAKGQVYTMAHQYLVIQLVSNIFSAVGYTLTGCIRALGYPRVEMVIIVAAVLINIVANAILTFGLGWGLSGIAMGTLVSECVCLLMAVWWISRHGFLPTQSVGRLHHVGHKVKELFSLGFAQMVIQALAGVTGMFVNNRLIAVATLQSVAVWNVVQRVYMLLLMPIVGMTQGIETILAYFNGSKQAKKMNQCVRLTMFYSMLYGVFAVGMVLAFGYVLLGGFGLSGDILAESCAVIKIVFITFPIVGVFFTIMTVLNVTGHEVGAVALSLLRQVVLILPLIYILPIIFSASSHAIFWAIPMADVSVILIAMGILFKGRKKA